MATRISYAVQRPAQGAVILNAYRALATSIPFDRITGLYAFASLKGARLLHDALSESSSWDSAVKRWVLSIDGGITEPEAIGFLLRQRRTEVRVPNAEELLASRLRPKRRFHPKTLLLERAITDLVPTGVIVGSANLTCNGLCFGHEHAMSAWTTASDNLASSLSTGLNELATVVDEATAVDASFVNRYAAIRPARPTLLEEFEDVRADQILQENPVIPATRSASLAAASNFWIDIEYVVPNRGKNEEGNQIDMQRGSRVFFGFGDHRLPRNSPIGSVQIMYEGHSAPRNLRFGNNQMDKLDLPIPGSEGPPSYSHQTLLFTLEAPGRYRLSVGSPATIADWKRRSELAGTRFSMQGGREFGVF